MNQNVAVTQTLPGPIAILKEAWVIYKAHLKDFLLISIPSAILMFLNMFLIKLPTNPIEIGFILVAFLIISLTYCCSFLTIYYLLKYNEQKIGVMGAFKQALTNLNDYIWLGIIHFLVTFSWFFLGFIPGIIVGFFFSFSTLAFVFEEDRGITALQKSREYIRGKFFAVAWRWVACILITMIITMIFSILQSIFITTLTFISIFIAVILKFNIISLISLLMGIISAVMNLCISIFSYSFSPLALYILYSHLKMNRQNMILPSKTPYKIEIGISLALVIIIVGVFIFFAIHP